MQSEWSVAEWSLQIRQKSWTFSPPHKSTINISPLNILRQKKRNREQTLSSDQQMPNLKAILVNTSKKVQVCRCVCISVLSVCVKWMHVVGAGSAIFANRQVKSKKRAPFKAQWIQFRIARPSWVIHNPPTCWTYSAVWKTSSKSAIFILILQFSVCTTASRWWYYWHLVLLWLRDNTLAILSIASTPRIFQRTYSIRTVGSIRRTRYTVLIWRRSARKCRTRA